MCFFVPRGLLCSNEENMVKRKQYKSRTTHASGPNSAKLCADVEKSINL